MSFEVWYKDVILAHPERFNTAMPESFWRKYFPLWNERTQKFEQLPHKPEGACEETFPVSCIRPAVGELRRAKIVTKSGERPVKACREHLAYEQAWDRWADHENMCLDCQDLRYCPRGREILDAAKAAGNFRWQR